MAAGARTAHALSVAACRATVGTPGFFVFFLLRLHPSSPPADAPAGGTVLKQAVHECIVLCSLDMQVVGHWRQRPPTVAGRVGQGRGLLSSRGLRVCSFVVARSMGSRPCWQAGRSLMGWMELSTHSSGLHLHPSTWKWIAR